MGLEVEVIADTNKFDVIVIGGGIAGMTASAVVTKSGLKSCFLERDIPGGKLILLKKINNFSLNTNVTGKDFALSIFKQVIDDIKTNYIYGEVQAIKLRNNKFYLFTSDGQAWETKAIIIAVGTKIKKLNIFGEDNFFNNGLSYSITNDAPLAKEKNVVLIGDFKNIDILKQYTNKITILNKNELTKFVGINSLQQIIKKDGTKIQCDYVFVENGFESNLNFLPLEIKKNLKNEIIVNENMETSYPGCFSCGDCINSNNKNVNQALKQATIAANSAVEYVKNKK